MDILVALAAGFGDMEEAALALVVLLRKSSRGEGRVTDSALLEPGEFCVAGVVLSDSIGVVDSTLTLEDAGIVAVVRRVALGVDGSVSLLRDRVFIGGGRWPHGFVGNLSNFLGVLAFWVTELSSSSAPSTTVSGAGPEKDEVVLGSGTGSAVDPAESDVLKNVFLRCCRLLVVRNAGNSVSSASPDITPVGSCCSGS